MNGEPLQKLLASVDHTLLSPDATETDIKRICDEAITYGAASVCIPPCYVPMAKAYVNDKLVIGTVVGFPNGYATTAIKVFEAEQYILSGADELDMVINIGMLKNGQYDEIMNEIRLIKSVCNSIPLKVIIETCLLTEDEKIKMCEIVSLSGADYIKTSTGFSKAGATFQDVALIQKHISGPLKIKAAGGIQTLEDAKKFLELGASRLGTSRIIKILNRQSAEGY